MTSESPLTLNDLTYHGDDGQALVRLALRSTLYLRDVRRKGRIEALKDCVRDFVARADGSLRWLYPARRGPLTLDATSVGPRLEAALATLDRKVEDTWELHLHAGESAAAASDLGVDALVVSQSEERPPLNQLSYVSVRFPVLWFAERRPGFPSFVLDCCTRLAPTHGYGGLALVPPPDYHLNWKIADVVRAVASRFPAVEIDSPVEHLLWVRKGLKGVNWLTVVGDEWLSTLGGADGLRARLPGGAVLHPYPGGCVVQAGAVPLTGDVNRRADVDAYRRVAALLRPVMIREHSDILTGAVSRVLFEQWLARFDQ